jgi:hypothetical protein
MLSQLAASTDEERRVWAQLVRHCLPLAPTSDLLSAVLEAAEQFAALREEISWLLPVQLGSPEAKRAKKDFWLQHRMAQRDVAYRNRALRHREQRLKTKQKRATSLDGGRSIA